MIFLLKKLYNISLSQTWSKKGSGSFSKIFRRVLKTAFHVSIGTFSAKDFFEKSINFFIFVAN